MSYRSDVATPQPSPHKAVAQRPPATRRDSGGAEARAPIRRRRAHSHRPGLCSDKWGASCPDVWSRGRRASPRQRGSCLGRRRSDGGPGPTKPVRPLPAPRRGASPLTRHPPAATPQPPTVIPAKGDLCATCPLIGVGLAGATGVGLTRRASAQGTLHPASHHACVAFWPTRPPRRRPQTAVQSMVSARRRL